MHLVPIAYWALGVRTAQMLAEAQALLAFRMLGMAGGWPVSPSEGSRMFLEKGPVFLRAYGDATTVAFKGKRLDEIADAALRPIRQKTRSNASRLGRGQR